MGKIYLLLKDIAYTVEIFKTGFYKVLKTHTVTLPTHTQYMYRYRKRKDKMQYLFGGTRKKGPTERGREREARSLLVSNILISLI